MADSARKPKEISSGEAAAILGRSYSQLYRYVESGDLHPKNALPPGMRQRGRKKRTLSFDLDEVKKLKASLESGDDGEGSGT